MATKMCGLLSFFFCYHLAFSQSSLPVVKATSPKAFIVEGSDDTYNWYINPKIKSDVHTLTKSTGPIWVTFHTDVDSIKVKIKPNKSFDFIVLLNGQDSCHTRIESWALRKLLRRDFVVDDTIPFVLTEFNNVKIKTILNDTDTLNLKFDSGTTGLLLTNDAIKHKTHSLNAEYSNNTLKMGGMIWDNLRVYPVELSGQGTDGRFGWDLFDQKIVEIDYDKKLFIIRNKLPALSKKYSKLDIEYRHTLFCVQGELQIKNKKFKNRFLVDNGYQRTILLDTLLMHEQKYPKNATVIKKVILKNGQGQEIPVITINNDRLNLGQESLFNIPVQLLTSSNPAQFKTHILGNEVLKRFNTFFDFQKNRVYLKPNKLINLPYTDAI